MLVLLKQFGSRNFNNFLSDKLAWGEQGPFLTEKEREKKTFAFLRCVGTLRKEW